MSSETKTLFCAVHVKRFHTIRDIMKFTSLPMRNDSYLLFDTIEGASKIMHGTSVKSGHIFVLKLEVNKSFIRNPYMEKTCLTGLPVNSPETLKLNSSLTSLIEVVKVIRNPWVRIDLDDLSQGDLFLDRSDGGCTLGSIKNRRKIALHITKKPQQSFGHVRTFYNCIFMLPNGEVQEKKGLQDFVYKFVGSE